MLWQCAPIQLPRRQRDEVRVRNGDEAIRLGRGLADGNARRGVAPGHHPPLGDRAAGPARHREAEAPLHLGGQPGLRPQVGRHASEDCVALEAGRGAHDRVARAPRCACRRAGASGCRRATAGRRGGGGSAALSGCCREPG